MLNHPNLPYVFLTSHAAAPSFQELIDALNARASVEHDSVYRCGLTMTRQLLGTHDETETGKFYWCPNLPAASRPWCSCHISNVACPKGATSPGKRKWCGNMEKNKKRETGKGKGKLQKG